MPRKSLVLLYRHVAQRGLRHCRHATATYYTRRMAIRHATTATSVSPWPWHKQRTCVAAPLPSEALPLSSSSHHVDQRNTHPCLDPGLSQENRGEEGAEGHQKVSAAHPAQIEGHVRDGREKQNPKKPPSSKESYHPHLGPRHLADVETQVIGSLAASAGVHYRLRGEAASSS